MNRLFYGDNLHVLRDRAHFPDACVDLIYLDPPFNSKRDYNLLFKSPKGQSSEAQIEAFEDTWHWNEQAEREYDEIVHGANTDLAQMIQALRSFLGENDMMAYLTMMANRLLELHRVLKPTGSLYLHCDPTASHYLKIVLDGVFGKLRFLNEITWKRTTAHNDPQRYGRIADRIYYYSKTKKKTFHPIGGEYSPEQLKRYKGIEGVRRFKGENLTAPKFSDTRTVLWRGVHPGRKRQWRFDVDELERLYSEGRILLRQDGKPRKDGYKEYLDEAEGPVMQDIWTDIALGPTSAERLEYETQKPQALLERIISASSNESDVVLDPFCGCGTTVHAAQKLNRQWIGIDITCLAISLIEGRLKKAYPEAFGEKSQRRLQYHVIGTPKDLESARHLAQLSEHDGRYQFQYWAVSLVDAQPAQSKKKGADKGIDGIKNFRDLDKEYHRLIVSVKSGKLKADDVRALNHVRDRERAEIGVLISLDEPTKGMLADAASAGFYESPNGKKYPRVQMLTIADLLDGKARAEHPDYEPDLNFKKAKQERSGQQQGLAL